MCSLCPVDPSVVCRVLSVCAVPERCGGVQSDPETTGCRSGPPRCRRDGHQHRPRDRIQHPAGDVLLQRHDSQVCVKLRKTTPKCSLLPKVFKLLIFCFVVWFAQLKYEKNALLKCMTHTWGLFALLYGFTSSGRHFSGYDFSMEDYWIMYKQTCNLQKNIFILFKCLIKYLFYFILSYLFYFTIEMCLDKYVLKPINNK